MWSSVGLQKFASRTFNATLRPSCNRPIRFIRRSPFLSQLSKRLKMILVSFWSQFFVLSLELGYGERNTNSVSPVRGYSPGPPPGGAIQYQTSPPTTSYYSSPSPTTPSGSTGANQPATCREQVIASVAAPPTQAYTYSGTTTSKLINRNNYAIFC